MASRVAATLVGAVLAAVALIGLSTGTNAQSSGSPTDISQPINGNDDDMLLLYRHTVYNNYASLALGEQCSMLNQLEIEALRTNIQKLAVDFRDRFGFTQQQWGAMVDTMAERYKREAPDCENRMARKFAKDVTRDIISLTR